jgi:hypothetical protein
LLTALSLRFDPFGGVSFAVQSVGGVVFFGMITWKHFCSEALSVRFNHLDALRLWFDIHHHCHDHWWRDAPSICVGREVIGILLMELERKTRKKELGESPDED